MEETTRGQFSPIQVAQLLQPIKPNRVLSDGKGHSHVSQQDIQAHLIRLLGFGNFDIEVIDKELVYEDPRVGKDGELSGRWDVCYRALARLTVRNEHGALVAFYENGSMGTAQNQTRGDAHDLAYKSAISLSIKRAAISLGDQFGLSLYNKGQMTALVRQTLIGSEIEAADVQDGIEQQVSLGNDEIDKTEHVATPEAPVANIPDGFIEKITAAVTETDLMALWAEATSGGFTAEVRPTFTAQKEFIASVVQEESK